MKKWIPTILAALLAAAMAIVPDVQAAVASNPLTSSLLVAVVAILTALAKSPLGQRPPKE